jgi:hypothetical protein
VFLGWILFRWTRERFGSITALLTLTLFAFSPTILAHSRYVTTDLGAAFGFFIGIIAYLRYLEIPTRKNLVLAGLIFGIAQLTKFSLVLLLPVYAIMILAWVLTRPSLHWHERGRIFWQISLNTAAILTIGFLLVWAVYGILTWNYPPERQFRDAEFILTSYGFRPIVNLDLQLIKNPFTRPIGQYLLGVLMVNQRAAGGNTAYFLGGVSAAGWKTYFPVLYLLKETLALHILTLIAVWFAVWKIWKRADVKELNSLRKSNFEKSVVWIRDHFVEFISLIFIAFYWALSIQSPLNIGIRHLMPTFPFIYLLIAKQIVEWLQWHEESNPHTWLGWLKNIYQLYIKSVPKYLLVGLLILWMITSAFGVYPHFLAYYNELVGAKNGYKMAVDSNYDWGQDLKRLRDFVNEHGIEKISVDYFGGGNPRYYLGDKFEPWWSSRGPASGWFAISATFRQGAFGKPVKRFERKPEDSYEWLKPYEPVARAGYSIFIYQLP